MTQTYPAMPRLTTVKIEPVSRDRFPVSRDRFWDIYTFPCDIAIETRQTSISMRPQKVVRFTSMGDAVSYLNSIKKDDKGGRIQTKSISCRWICRIIEGYIVKTAFSEFEVLDKFPPYGNIIYPIKSDG